MKESKELNRLMAELLENSTDYFFETGKFTDRGLEIIEEISDYAEQTEIFKEHKKRGAMFDGSTVQDVFLYMINRIVNAPTTIHRDMSVLFIMPFVRQKLRYGEDKANEATDNRCTE